MYVLLSNGQVVGFISKADSSFPDVTLLDDFDRANASTLGSNWTPDPGGFGAQSPTIVNNSFSIPGDSNPAESWWNPETFGSDVVIVTTLDQITTTPTNSFGIWLRVTNPGDDTNITGYIAALQYDGPGWRAVLYSLPDYDSQDAAITTTPVADDKFGIVAEGTTFTFYLYHGDQWVEIASFTDALYEQSGYIATGGFNTSGSTLRLFKDISVGEL